MNKIFTYFVFLIAVSAGIVTPAQGDTMLEFTDGTKHVWSNIKVKSEEVCTELSYGGTYCCRRADVVRSYAVQAGTQATDMGMNMGAVQIDGDVSAHNQRAIDDMSSHARQRDAEIAQRQKQFEREQHRKRVDGKSEWSQ